MIFFEIVGIRHSYDHQMDLKIFHVRSEQLTIKCSTISRNFSERSGYEFQATSFRTEGSR